MLVHVPLAGSLSADDWSRRYEAGEVPDSSPYGLRKLTESGIVPDFESKALGPVSRRISNSLKYRIDGLESVEALRDIRPRLRSNTDAVLCYDERTGIPAALLASASKRFAPVVSGVGWITHRSAPYPEWNRLFGYALTRTAALWSQSRPVLDVLHNEWGVERQRLHFVPLGIDAEFYRVRGETPVPGRVMSAGEDRFRDHGLLVDAVALVRTSVPDVHLELATGLPVDVPADLGTVHTERLDGRMRNLYGRAGVVALALRPTISGSGLTVVLEAMSSGRPVVVTDNPGIRDYVEDGVTGVLVPAGDAQALADAIRSVLADPDRAAAMGHAAAKRVRSDFTSGVMAGHLAKIVRSIA